MNKPSPRPTSTSAPVVGVLGLPVVAAATPADVVELDGVVVPDDEPAVDVPDELVVVDELLVEDELLVDDALLVVGELLVDDEVLVVVAGVTPHVTCPTYMSPTAVWPRNSS